MNAIVISPQVPVQGGEYSKLTSISWSMGLLVTFNSMRLNNEMCDVKIILSDKSALDAHKCVLAGASPFLKSLLQGPEKHDINMENFPAEVVKEIIEFIYTGTATVRKGDLCVFQSMSAMLDLTTLTEMAVKLMQTNVAKSNGENLNECKIPFGEELTAEHIDNMESSPFFSTSQGDYDNLGDVANDTSTLAMNNTSDGESVLINVGTAVERLRTKPLKKVNPKSPGQTRKKRKPEQPKFIPKVTSLRRSRRLQQKDTPSVEESSEASGTKKKRERSVEPEEVEVKQEIMDDVNGGGEQNSNSSEVPESSTIMEEHEAFDRQIAGMKQTAEEAVTSVMSECGNSDMREIINTAIAHLDTDAATDPDDNHDNEKDGGMDASYNDDDDADDEEKGNMTGLHSARTEISLEGNLSRDVTAHAVASEKHGEDILQNKIEKSAARADMAPSTVESSNLQQPKPIQVFKRKGNSFVLETVVPHIEGYVGEPDDSTTDTPDITKVTDPSLPDLKGMGIYVKQAPGAKKPRRNRHGIALARAIDVPVHDGETYMCEVCNRCFTDKDFLNRHRNSHFLVEKEGDDLKKRFHCSYCPYKSNYKHVLVEHERTHTGEKPYECTICGKKFTHRKGYQLHKTLHKGLKYTCDICGKIFTFFPNLKSHIRLMHTPNNRPHKCPVCSRTFKLAYTLTRHMNTHSNKRAFKCPHCPKTFVVRQYLKAHIDSKHLGRGPKYPCENCGKVFKCRWSVKHHKCKRPEPKEKQLRKLKPRQQSHGKTQQELIAEGAEVVLDDKIKELNYDQLLALSLEHAVDALQPKENIVAASRVVSDGETSSESDIDDMLSDNDLI